MNCALIITATFSLIGVSLAAILNYHSNIKTSNKKLEFEENKMKYEFYKEIISKLNAALNELQSMSIQAYDKKRVEKIQEFNQRAEIIFNGIKLYINKENRKDVQQKYQMGHQIIDNILIENNLSKISQADLLKINEGIIIQTKTRIQLKTIIEEEIESLIVKMKDFNFQ